MDKPTFCLIGDGTLLVQCAMFLMKKFEIKRIITSNSQIEKWATDKGIEVIQNINDDYLYSKLKEVEFDYLLSIVYLKKIKKEVLALPKKISINFHDSLLPSYAGLYATSWAILNEEKKHGVTWHVIEEGLDTGDIVLQSEFDISSDETAYTLNVKCFNAAFSLFLKMIKQFEQGEIVFQKQREIGKSYYGMTQVKGRSWELDFSKMSAREISRMIRALDLDPAPTFAKLTFQVGENRYFASKIVVLDKKSRELPGTVLRLEGDKMELATLDNNILIDYDKE